MIEDIIKIIKSGSEGSFETYLKCTELDICELKDNSGFNLIHICSYNSKTNMLRSLLLFGQTLPKQVYNKWINAYSNEGMTPLLLSVYKGQFEQVQILVQFDADLFERTPLGLSVIHLCAQGNYPEILIFFYQLGLDIDSKDNKGGTPLHWAAYMGNFNTLSLLLGLKVNIDARDNDGRTPLYLGVMSGNEKIVRKLVVYGANTEIQDKKGKKPLDLARESGSKDIIKMLSEVSFAQKIACRTKLKKPVKNLKHVVAILLFITFSFAFIIFFCAKQNNLGSFLLIGIVVAVLANLFYLMACDPGFASLPKSYSWQELYKNHCDDICVECKIVKPQRSRHCFYCGRCVNRYDHHCQWINNCVGIKNNNMFLLFLLSLVVLCLVVDYIAVDIFLNSGHGGVFDSGYFSYVAAIFSILVSSLVLYPISILLIVQLKNFSSNQTSNERLSKSKEKGKRSGCCLTNFYKMCCKI